MRQRPDPDSVAPAPAGTAGVDSESDGGPALHAGGERRGAGGKATPKRLAEFDVVRRLGTGGMAEVFLAKKRGAEGTYKLLVLKRILPDYMSSRRFRIMFAEEAQLATRLNHPNIVQVYDFQDYGDEGQLLSMEYVDGPDLRALTKALAHKGERLSPPLAAYIVSEVAKGLHYAHERKDERGVPLDIVHRDVSPQNVLLSYDGGVKIADFGIATANLFREESGVLKGKTGYMSPEQARGLRVDRRTDIYSLGVVFHELLTGRPLHGSAEGDALLEAVRLGTIEPPSTYVLGVPKEFDEIALKVLAPDPAERYQTAREFSLALSHALFALDELVDAHTLEATIVRVFGEKKLDERYEGESSTRAPTGESAVEVFDEAEGTPVQPLLAQREQGREVRHVAVISLELVGHQNLVDRLGEHGARAALDRVASTFDAIAFKRNLELDWQRENGLLVRARGVAGLMAHAASAAADAMWFSVDLHEGVAAAREDLDVDLTARIGVVRSIATGRRDALGHLVEHELAPSATFLADLLREQARPGSSLVAGGLYRLVRRDFLWGDAPNIEIARASDLDLPPRMRVYSLLRGLTREEKLQEVALAPTELIGRDAEMADLHAAYYRAVGQNPGETRLSARVVSGELGIGKTALVNAFLNELPPDARVLRTECAQSRQEMPYAVVGDWLRELTGTKPEQPLELAKQLVEDALGWSGDGHAAEMVERLAELCTGRLSAAYDEAEAAHQRHLLLTGLRRFVARACQDGPLVIVLDSMQWCDVASLELVSVLSTQSDPVPVLLLLVTRPDQRVAPFLQRIVRLDLGGLSTENQARLLQVRLGVAPGVERACSDVLPRAAGNPYFLLEMVDALLERGVLEIRESESGAQILERVDVAGSVLSLPTTLEQLLADRLTELSDEEQRLLDWIAVAGGPLPFLDLEQLFGLDAEEVLARLSARGLVEVRDGRVDVKHPLTRDVAYRSMGKDRRQELHRGLGQLLAGSGQHRGILAATVARHLAKGGSFDQAAELYLEAAGVARSSYQVPIATRCYKKVVAMLPADDVRLLEAHEALEAIARNEARFKERRQHLEELRRLAATSQSGYWVATALLRSARFELDGGHLVRAAQVATASERAALEAGSMVIALQARALLAEVLRDLGDMQGALSAVDRALQSSDHPEITARLRAEVLRAKGTLLRRVGRVLEALDAYAESIAVFQQVGARRMEARAKSSMAFALYVLGRYEDGIVLGEEAMAIDLAIGGRFQVAKTLANIGLCRAGAGMLTEGLDYLERAREAHERYGERDSRADTLLVTAEVLLEMGDLERAFGLVIDAAALTRVTESRYDAIHERILRALVARARGRPDEAAARAFEARQGAEAQAYAAFHFYAMAIESIARVEVGEQHTGILLATTALGAIEALQGSEYSLQTRALSCEALERAGSPQAAEMRRKAARYVQERADGLRDPAHWRAFLERPPVVALLSGGASAKPQLPMGAI